MKEKELLNWQAAMISLAEQIIEESRRQNYEAVHALMSSLIARVEMWVSSIVECGIRYQESGIDFPDVECITKTIEEICTTQQEKDWVLLADYLQMSFLPMIYQCQQSLLIVLQEEALQPDDAIYNKNSSKLSDPTLQSILKNVECYPLEPTNSGLLTIALQDEGGRYYLHSNTNPFQEATALIREYYTPKTDDYIVIGSGLGYHVVRLLAQSDTVFVSLYEADIRMIKTMLSVVDFSGYFAENRLKIYYDPDMKKLQKRLPFTDEEEIIIHAPSLRNIKNEEVQLQLKQYFVMESGYRNQKNLLEHNFYRNVKTCVKTVEDITASMEGKEVVIVAAGPSLTKQKEYLIQYAKEGKVIVAVSTVYRKLLSWGITPDFVVHTDAQIKTYSHLRDIDAKAPLLLLSTGCEACARKYGGMSCIAFQKDYDLSEQYAKEHSYRLYETGGSVTTFALDIVCQAQASRIVLIGLDLAYTNGLAHAQGVSRQAVGDLSNSVKVEGYYGEPVASSAVFSNMIQWFENYVKRHKDYQRRIINATEGGAKIRGMKQMPFSHAFAD